MEREDLVVALHLREGVKMGHDYIETTAGIILKIKEPVLKRIGLTLGVQLVLEVEVAFALVQNRTTRVPIAHLVSRIDGKVVKVRITVVLDKVLRVGLRVAAFVRKRAHTFASKLIKYIIQRRLGVR